MLVSVFVERMEDMDIFRLQTIFVIQGLVTCSWDVKVIKDIAHLVGITSVSSSVLPATTGPVSTSSSFTLNL